MPDIGPFELILIGIVLLLVFGPGKAADLGSSVGKALREFRNASRADVATTDETAAAEPVPVATAHCTECGASVVADAAFCSACGHPLAQTVTSAGRG